jgi:hypothetical protein
VIEENVLRFQIAMINIEKVMNIADCDYDLTKKTSAFGFGKGGFWTDAVRKAAVFRQLHDEIEMLIIFKNFEEFNNVLMNNGFKNSLFSMDESQCAGAVDSGFGDLFDRNGGTDLIVNAKKNIGKGTGTEFVKESVFADVEKRRIERGKFSHEGVSFGEWEGEGGGG